eukprot:IDg2049t1
MQPPLPRYKDLKIDIQRVCHLDETGTAHGRDCSGASRRKCCDGKRASRYDLDVSILRPTRSMQEIGRQRVPWFNEIFSY